MKPLSKSSHLRGGEDAASSQSNSSSPDQTLGDDSEERLLEIGNLMLQSLACSAAAKQAAAERAELELLLARAQAGQVEPLRAWLDLRECDAADVQPGQGKANGPLSPLDGSSQAGRKDALEAAGSWEPFRQLALARLAQQELPPGRPSHNDIDADRSAGGKAAGIEPGQGREAVDSVRPHRSDRKESSFHKPYEPYEPKASHASKASPPSGTSAASLRERSERSEWGKRQEVRKKSEASSAGRSNASKAQMHAATSALAGEMRQQSSAPQKGGRSAKGVIASLVAHLVLLVLLAVITLETPSMVASMTLQSAPPAEIDTQVEITQPPEPNTPDATSQQMAATESVEEVAEQLTQFTDSLASAVDKLATPVASSPAKIAAASELLASSTAAASASASFFGASASGNNFCYVIDGSASMRGGAWEAAKAELLKSLASLQAHQRFYIILFKRELDILPEPGSVEPASRSLYATAENLNHARRWVQSLRIDVGAPPNEALGQAINIEPDAIYLLTDGVTKVDVCKFLRAENRVADLLGEPQIRVPIHSIAYYSLDGKQLLQQIAAENSGQFIYVPDPRRR